MRGFGNKSKYDVSFFGLRENHVLIQCYITAKYIFFLLNKKEDPMTLFVEKGGREGIKKVNVCFSDNSSINHR